MSLFVKNLKLVKRVIIFIKGVIDKGQVMNLRILWLLNVCGYNPESNVKCKHKFH